MFEVVELGDVEVSSTALDGVADDEVALSLRNWLF